MIFLLYFQEIYETKKKVKEALKKVKKEEIARAVQECHEDRTAKMEVIVKHLELVIMAFVKFAKMIPRFMDLPLNDQAALVKCKFCETSWRDEGGRVLSISLFKSTQNVYVLPLIMLKHFKICLEQSNKHIN